MTIVAKVLNEKLDAKSKASVIKKLKQALDKLEKSKNSSELSGFPTKDLDKLANQLLAKANSV